MAKRREDPFSVEALAATRPHPTKRRDVHDYLVPGLVCTITPGGARVFYLVRKVAGRTERMKIGNITEVDVHDARDKALSWNGKIVDGKNPAEIKRAERREMTLGQLWTLYRSKHGEAKRSARTDLNRWSKHLKPWASRRLSAITRPDVVKLLERIRVTAGPVQANRTRGLLHAVFAKAIAWDIMQANPVAGTPKNRETTRERYLTPPEVRRFLRALDETPDVDLTDWCRLLLFTGQRSHTVYGARWRDFDLRDRLWTIPAESMKAGRELVVPLAPAVAALLKLRKTFTRKGAVWVFPSTRHASGHMMDLREGFTALLARAEIEGVTPHDLRRTLSTWAVAVGIPYEVIAKALGHSPVGGVTSVYARVHLDLVRAAVERAVAEMLKVAALAESDDEAAVLQFARPAWAAGA